MSHAPDQMVQLFMEHLAPPNRLRLSGVPAASEILVEMLTGAGSTWPEVSVDQEQLLAYLAERFPDGGALERQLRNWAVQDLYLCCAAARGDHVAIAAFEVHFLPVIRGTLHRLELGGALIEDLEQHLRHLLLVGDGDRPPMITGYRGLGRLAGWLRVVTTRIARKALGKEKRHVLVGDGQLAERLLEEHPSAEMIGAKQVYRSTFKDVFKRAMATLEARQINLLRQRYVDELSLEQMAAIYRVHHTTVHRWLEKVRQALLERTYDMLQDQLGVSETDCRSIIRLIQSDFDLTLHGFFGTVQEDGGES